MQFDLVCSGEARSMIDPPREQMAASGPSLPISDVRFDGEFRRDSRLVVLTWSFVQIGRVGM
jgi:hypothetical protein